LHRNAALSHTSDSLTILTLLPHTLHPSLIYCPSHHTDLHSFPTRRSSDLRSACTSAREAWSRRGAQTRRGRPRYLVLLGAVAVLDRKSTRLNSSHVKISYAVFCLKKKKGVLYVVRCIS